MTFDHLAVLANLAAILTAAVALYAYGRYLWERRDKRIRLERHLRDERGAGDDQGQRTLLHLVAHLGMSEAEIIDAAFRSKLIQRKVSVDSQGRADRLLLYYEDDREPLRPKRPGRARF